MKPALSVQSINAICSDSYTKTQFRGICKAGSPKTRTKRWVPQLLLVTAVTHHHSGTPPLNPFPPLITHWRVMSAVSPFSIIMERANQSRIRSLFI